MTHLFISYAKQDTRDLALSLTDALNSLEEVTAWVDRSLRAGRSWELQIQSEIDRCDVMIVLYSPDINRHKQGKSESYVLTEIAYAKWTARKPIIPVMAQRTDPPISLTMEHYIDFTLDGLTLDDLVVALCDELNIAVRQRPIPASAPHSADILPAPFEWIEIPGGRGTMRTDVSAFWLFIPTERYWTSKYLITNAQFAKFIEAGGYRERKWWTKTGWVTREEGWHYDYDNEWKPSGKSWIEPLYWQDAEWNGAEQPVVGVSWNEAVAFCLWLTEVTGENIMLPTEDQWQYAAQGDDGRAYPWGKDWDCRRCNNSVKPCDGSVITPVRQYEGKGDSPFGVVDMAGNVWEWCLTDYDDRINDINLDAANRVLRGGSWDSKTTDDFRCDRRFGYFPHSGRYVNVGFRIFRY